MESLTIYCETQKAVSSQHCNILGMYCVARVRCEKTNCKLFDVLIGYLTINDSWNTVFQVITISEFDSNINWNFFEI